MTYCKLRLLLSMAVGSMVPIAHAETLASPPLVGGVSIHCFVANVSAVPIKVKSVELISAITGQTITSLACGSLAPGVGCHLVFQPPGVQLGAYCQATHYGVEGSLTGVMQMFGQEGSPLGITHMWRLPAGVAP